MKEKNPYTILASYYDDFVGKNRYKEWSLFLEKIVKKYKITTDFAIDLACGTGINSKTLKDIGFKKVVGIDKSQSMLNKAKDKYKNIDFYRKTFLSFYGNKFINASLVTCFYDSLNYLLSESELQKAFINVHKALKSGGIFVFDLNTPGHIKGISGNCPSVFTNNGLFVIMKNSYDGNLWFLNLFIFVKKNNNLFSLFKEKHVEMVYSEKQVTSLLKKIGFVTLEIKREMKEYQDGKKYNNRTYYIVKK